MFDTMTWVKALSGIFGTFLVFLLGGWAAEVIYHGGGGHDGHDYAYVIHAEEDGAEAVEVEGPPFEEIYAMADPVAGEREFRACAGCHANEPGVNGTGPYLHGVVGRATGAAQGFAYSGSLSAVVDVWTPEALNLFLTNPGAYAPGTTMTYNGMRDEEDRANLIAYLDSLDD